MDSSDCAIKVSIENVLYPITEQVIHQVFDDCGSIQHMDWISPENGDVQVLIWFRSSWSATWAKRVLHGRHIYEGCCRLNIEICKPIMTDSKQFIDSIYDQNSNRKSENSVMVEEFASEGADDGASDYSIHDEDIDQENAVVKFDRNEANDQENARFKKDSRVQPENQVTNYVCSRILASIRASSDYSQVSVARIFSCSVKNSVKDEPPDLPIIVQMPKKIIEVPKYIFISSWKLTLQAPDDYHWPKCWRWWFT